MISPNPRWKGFFFRFAPCWSALVILVACKCAVTAAEWPKYSDEEMFAKADFIVVGRIEEELPEKKNGLQQARLKVDKTLLSELGGSVKSMIVMYHGPDSDKGIGVLPGMEGVWLLRRTMAGNSVIHPQQIRPLAEEEKVIAGLSEWLPAAFQEQVDKVRSLRTRDPDGGTPESVSAVIGMFRRSEQIRMLPGDDDGERQRKWIERLRAMLALYDLKMDFPTEAKTADDKRQLVARVAKIIGKAPEPDSPLHERMAAQAPGLLAHVYGNLIQQTVAADDARFPDSAERFAKRLEDADVDRLNTRVSALQYLVDLANAGELR